MSWFELLFGMSERASYSAVQRNFVFDKGAGKLLSKANDKIFHVGRFSTPTLSDLRLRGRAALLQLNQNNQDIRGAAQNTSSLRFDHVTKGDILLEHWKYPNAVFQAASQFNCLEFPSPDVVPENGITGYIHDSTQGPACALACAAGTVVRNYFVDVPFLPPGEAGQRTDNQLNNLDELETVLRNYDHCYWRVKNGYTFSDNPDRLLDLARVIASSKRLHSSASLKTAPDAPNDGSGVPYSYDDLLGYVKVGLHEDVEVNFKDRSLTPVVNDSDRNTAAVHVTQVYCSAVSCGYSGVPNQYWEQFAQLVLDANYEATLWSAVLNAARSFDSSNTDSSSSSISNSSSINCSDGGSDFHKDVFLTLLGGGVFQNDMKWIAGAIGRAVAVLEHAGAPINVHICHYRSIKENTVELVQQAYEQHKQAMISFSRED